MFGCGCLFGAVSCYSATLGTKGYVGVIKPLVGLHKTEFMGVGNKHPSGNQRNYLH